MAETNSPSAPCSTGGSCLGFPLLLTVTPSHYVEIQRKNIAIAVGRDLTPPGRGYPPATVCFGLLAIGSEAPFISADAGLGKSRLKDQCCSWSKRFCDSDCLESLSAFASELSAEPLVASSADDSRVFCYVFAAFSVGCYVVKFRRVRLLRSVPVVGDGADWTAHVAAFECCGEFLSSEVLPAGGAGAAGCHCFTPPYSTVCLWVGGGCFAGCCRSVAVCVRSPC